MTSLSQVSSRTLKAAPVFAALGEPIRLSLIARLSDHGPLATTRLQADARMSRQALTKHLRVLESAGLVTSTRVGRDRQWQMQIRHLAIAAHTLEQLSRQWDQRLERLQLFLQANGSQA